MGLGVDLTHPLQEALGLLSPPLIAPHAAAPPVSARTGWLFHLDAKNVVATHWSPLIEDGQNVGFRTRLLETCGRAARTRLSCCRRSCARGKWIFWAHRWANVGSMRAALARPDGTPVG